MTNKKYAEDMTVDELIDVLNKKRHEEQWVGDGNGWYSRYIIKVSEICQQIVPEGGKWECASHFMRPDGLFDSLKDAMEAFDIIEDPFKEKQRGPYFRVISDPVLDAFNDKINSATSEGAVFVPESLTHCVFGYSGVLMWTYDSTD